MVQTAGKLLGITSLFLSTAAQDARSSAICMLLQCGTRAASPRRTCIDTSTAAAQSSSSNQCVTSTKLVGSADSGDGVTFGNSVQKNIGPERHAVSSSYSRPTRSRIFASSAKISKRSSASTASSRVISSDGSGKVVERQRSRRRKGTWPRHRTQSIACSSSIGLV